MGFGKWAPDLANARNWQQPANQTSKSATGFVFHIKQLRRSNILWDACGENAFWLMRWRHGWIVLDVFYSAIIGRQNGGNVSFPPRAPWFYKRSERRKRGRGMSWNQRRWQWRQQESRCSGFTVLAQQTLSVAPRRSSYSSRAGSRRNTSLVWCSVLAAGRVNNMLIQVLLNINVNGCGGCCLTGSCLWKNPLQHFLTQHDQSWFYHFNRNNIRAKASEMF